METFRSIERFDTQGPDVGNGGGRLPEMGKRAMQAMNNFAYAADAPSTGQWNTTALAEERAPDVIVVIRSQDEEMRQNEAFMLLSQVLEQAEIVIKHVEGATGVVGPFPNLQAAMKRYYAHQQSPRSGR